MSVKTSRAYLGTSMGEASCTEPYGHDGKHQDTRKGMSWPNRSGGRARCAVSERPYALKADGTVRHHLIPRPPGHWLGLPVCKGVGQKPLEARDDRA